MRIKLFIAYDPKTKSQFFGDEDKKILQETVERYKDGSNEHYEILDEPVEIQIDLP